MFGKAWELGRISGIQIRVHWSFLIIPFLVYYSSIAGGEGLVSAFVSVGLVLAVFGCVLLHELGHAFAARQFGIGTRDIILLPIGGVASLEYMPRNPFQELWIAIAGPLVNVVIAIVLFFGLAYSPITLGPAVASFVQSLAVINVALVVFNLIPAFPMDGGRVLRSVMALFMSYEKSTVIAATVGKYCAILLALYGLFNYQTHFMMVFLAAFVYLAGQAEKMQVLYGSRRQARPPQRPQSDSTEYFYPTHEFHSNQSFGQQEISVPSTLSGHSVAAWLSNMHAEYCSVVESGRIIGRITKSQLMTALSQGFGNLPIGQILMQRT